MVDLKKYDNKVFSKDPAIDKKIKALYLLFDKYVDDLKLNQKQKNKAINNWISKFIENEEYELADAFKKRKIQEWKSWRKITRLMSVSLFYRVWRFRIYRMYKILITN